MKPNKSWEQDSSKKLASPSCGKELTISSIRGTWGSIKPYFINSLKDTKNPIRCIDCSCGSLQCPSSWKKCLLSKPSIKKVWFSSTSPSMDLMINLFRSLLMTTSPWEKTISTTALFPRQTMSPWCSWKKLLPRFWDHMKKQDPYPWKKSLRYWSDFQLLCKASAIGTLCLFLKGTISLTITSCPTTKNCKIISLSTLSSLLE